MQSSECLLVKAAEELSFLLHSLQPKQLLWDGDSHKYEGTCASFCSVLMQLPWLC